MWPRKALVTHLPIADVSGALDRTEGRDTVTRYKTPPLSVMCAQLNLRTPTIRRKVAAFRSLVAASVADHLRRPRPGSCGGSSTFPPSSCCAAYSHHEHSQHLSWSRQLESHIGFTAACCILRYASSTCRSSSWCSAPPQLPKRACPQRSIYGSSRALVPRARLTPPSHPFQST